MSREQSAKTGSFQNGRLKQRAFREVICLPVCVCVFKVHRQGINECLMTQ